MKKPTRKRSRQLPPEAMQELREIFRHPDFAKGRLRDIELIRGSTEEYPLDPNDWEDGLVMIRGIEARIIIVNARKPRSGAFTRLIATIRETGLMPVVVEPIGPVMMKILHRWGWQPRKCGSGFNSWEEWRP